MTASPDSPAPVLDTAFFRRWLDLAAAAIRREADHLTDLDSAIGDADHGSNMRRGFDSASTSAAYAAATTPGALLKGFGTHLIGKVGGASGPLYGTVLRRAAKALGEDGTVSPQALGEALAAAVAGVRRLGDSGPGDKTMVDALAPAAEAYQRALGEGAPLTGALAAAARAAREGAEATIPMRARRGRASYLGERSVGHQDPGATSTALLFTALHEAAAGPAPETVGETGTEAGDTAGSGAAGKDVPAPPGGGTAAGSGTTAGRTDAGTGAAGTAPASAGTGGAPGRVGVVLVSHSREVAESTARLARDLVGTGDPSPVVAAGGAEAGGIGTSSELVRQAVARADEGAGVVVLCDMGSAVLTVKTLLAGTGPDALPEDVRIADAPFVEGAVATVVTASAGADLGMVLSAADDARTFRKL
ncbi:hypothetical protein ADZ36_30995 [Streptomyces fradiae]|uniref:Uncharacterized protein n=1 Tax=Streptomyces fradiae TaxID=1906 RepID=A0ACC4W2G1_STRFR|nr:hypothetical protein ADZ36_30995 [Streptomyces fradiae]OFA45758.1 dihydroxyacetone kinase subunit L [Streptomyces fradiae]RNC71086.1 dihydroxyacetone kinase subunit L [Streptomyces xinghaiensis]